MTRVLVYDSSYRTVRETVGSIFSTLDVDLRGKRVLIKPNALNEREPEAGANTHPSLLAAVVEAARAAGAIETVVADNPGQANYGNIRSVFEANGLGEAAGDALRNLGLDLVPRQIPSLEGVALFFPSLLFEVDYVINVPKLKVHPGTGLTSAIKNCFGYLPGAQKAFCHVAASDRRHFERILADVYRLRPPNLNIVDAILANGGRAQGGTSLRYLGKVLASTSAARVDVLGASILGLDPASVYHLSYIACEEDVRLDAAELSISGEWEALSDLWLPPGFNPGETRSTTTATPGLMKSASSKMLVLDQATCTGQGRCAEQCPTGALTMTGGYPELDQDDCVACFACVEACTPRAIRLEPGGPVVL